MTNYEAINEVRCPRCETKAETPMPQHGTYFYHTCLKCNERFACFVKYVPVIISPALLDEDGK